MRLARSAASEKVWFTTAELAALALPGLPSRQSHMADFARKARWAEKFDAAGNPLSRKRAGRGGGAEYHHSLLPPSAALELVKRGFLTASQEEPEVELTEFTAPVYDWDWFDAQTAKVKDEAKRRLIAVQQVELITASGVSKSAAVPQVAALIQVAAATIWNWLALVEGVEPADRLPALAPKRKGGGQKVEFDPGLWQHFKSLMLTPTARTFAGSYHRTREDYAKPLGLIMPDLKTMTRRFWAEVPREVYVLKRQGGKALMETIPAQERTVADLYAMALINIDGHKFDVFVTPPDGGDPIRPILIGMQDVYSRRMLAWRLCGEESIFHTRLCFADLFARYGIPKAVLMDNGRAFASKYLTGGVKTRFRYVIKETDPFGLLPALGVTVHFATPEHGQAKPIERGFGDLVSFIAHDPACEGAYTGNSPMNKPHNYGAKVLDWATFSALVNARIAEYNAKQGRRTEMARGRSFDEAYAASIAQHPVQRATEAQVAMALLEARSHKTDRKTGEIRILGNRYHHPALYERNGQDVTVRFDPDNLHAPIYVYETNGRLICKADPIEKTGFLDTEAARLIAKQKADLRKTARRLAEAEGLLAASELNRFKGGPEEPAQPEPRPAVARLVRTRGHSAAAAKIVAHGAPVNDQAPVIDRFSAVIERLYQPAAQPRLTVFDGGLAAQQEPERPRK